MLSVLLIGVGVAWLLVRKAGQAPVRGAEIMTQLHSTGLPALWRNEPPIQWYLIHTGKRALGWRVLMKRPRSDGGFDGLDVVITRRPTGTSGNWERWTLNSDATDGDYEAAEFVRRPGSWTIKPDARIRLKDGTVYFEHAGGGSGQTPAPENYVPEGTLELVYYLAGQESSRARFQTVFNQLPPEGRQIRFGQIAVADVNSTGKGVQVTVKSAAPRGDSSVLSFDDRGRLIGRTHGNIEEAAASQQEVLNVFPGALGDIKRIMKVSKFAPSLPSPEEDAEPDGQPDSKNEAVDQIST